MKNSHDEKLYRIAGNFRGTKFRGWLQKWKFTDNTFHFVVHISIIKESGFGSQICKPIKFKGRSKNVYTFKTQNK